MRVLNMTGAPWRVRCSLGCALATLVVAGACRHEDTGTRSAYEEAASGVPIRGHVGALVEQGDKGEPVLVPAIEVWAHDELTGGDSARVTTNPAGYFETPPLAAGAYRICVAGAGYATSCSAVTTVAGDIVTLETPVPIASTGSVVWGTVQLADGAPCYWDRPAFGTLVSAKVELVDATTGALVGGPVPGNSVGQYVIPTPAPGSYKVRASCEAAETSALLALGGVPARVDLVVGNRRPRLENIAFTRAGVGVRRADPGDSVEATILAGDPDGDALHYTWIDDTGRALGLPDAASVTWPLYNREALSTVLVQVSDGRGGYAVARRSLRTDDGTVVIAGRVVDRATGAPVDQAEVSVSGVVALTGSDGGFEVTLPDATRFVLNANKPGYALTSRVYNAAHRELEIPLDRVQVQPFDAATGGTLRFVTPRGKQDKPLVFDMQIGPGSFVDASGAPYSGPATMELFQYDTSQPYPIPGDQAGEWGGAGVRLETKGSFHLTPRDKLGGKLQMASGRSADVAFDIEPPQRASAPATIPFFLYEESTGIWKEHGTLTRAGDRYLGRVKHFTAFNADTAFANSSCLKIIFDGAVIPDDLSFPLYLFGFYTDPATGTFAHNDTAVSDLRTPIGIIRLAPFQEFRFQIRDRFHHLLLETTVNSGEAVSPGGGVEADGNVTDVNFSRCHPVTLRLGNIPEPHPGFLVPAGAPDHTRDYRDATQALDGQAKFRLDGWKMANGFPLVGAAADEASAVYFNDGDLKFGRDMHCRKDPGTQKTACYVTNYGTVGTDTAAAALLDARAHRGPVATVAMEYDPGATGGQNVQFWAYNSEGIYLAAPALDSEGPKTIPEMCQACHQGFYNPMTRTASGSVFLPFDLESFKYDAIGDPFQGGAVGAARQEDFRRLNALVYGTHPHGPAPTPVSSVADLIERWYPFAGGVTGASTFQRVSAAIRSDLEGGRREDGGYPFENAPYAHAALYNDVVEPVCRTCHIARPAGDWTRYSQMTPGRIAPRVCGPLRSPISFSMPHAEVPYKRFWQRGLDSILVATLPLGSCPSR